MDPVNYPNVEPNLWSGVVAGFRSVFQKFFWNSVVVIMAVYTSALHVGGSRFEPQRNLILGASLLAASFLKYELKN